MARTRPRQLELPFEYRARDTTAGGHIVLKGRLVDYLVRRSRRRRTYTLTIDERGLRVGVPWQATPRAIESELRRHEAWIVRTLARWEARRAPPLRWEDGATLMLLGEPLRLTVADGCGATLAENARLRVGVPVPQRPEDVARTVRTWLSERALACFRARVAHYAPRLCVQEPELRLSAARTRWGSCHPAGRILLNWRLIQMPLRLLDYVVVHELAHLREPNHSPRFWRTVASVMPDYAARRKEMRTDGHRYLVA